MSVVSSRLSSVSSILKGSGVRASLVGTQKKIRFKLPDNLKLILLNYENGCNRQEYQDIICILRDSSIKDFELLEFINNLQECMSMLGPVHKLLIEVLLNIHWINRSVEVTTCFKKFIEDLICMHIHHSKLIIDKLINQFKLLEEKETQWKNGKCPEIYLVQTSHIHELLSKFLKIIPMSSEILIQSLNSLYPQVNGGITTIERYQYSLLQIMSYAPQLRKDILGLIIRKLIALDVATPPSEILNYEDDDMEEDDETIFNLDESNAKNNSKILNNTGMSHPGAEILDVCMEQVLSYVYDCCHVEGQLIIESLKSIYYDLLHIFERIILTTQFSHHVQFIMFYICSFKPMVAEAFIRWLWQRISCPHIMAPVRQTSMTYISSLLARATYVPNNLIQGVLSEMSSWIHSYISSQDSLESTEYPPAVHALFYSMCQAMFYLLAFRHKDLTDGKDNLLFLQELNLTKIITCRLNPLKFCQPAVVQNFAAVTRKYQLAYCYTVIERNSRSNLPVVHSGNYTAISLETFFPFDPYLLTCSGRRIAPLYNSSQCTTSTTPAELSSSPKDKTCDENDFMDESFLSRSAESQSNLDKFSYSTSPGFMYT